MSPDQIQDLCQVLPTPRSQAQGICVENHVFFQTRVSFVKTPLPRQTNCTCLSVRLASCACRGLSVKCPPDSCLSRVVLFEKVVEPSGSGTSIIKASCWGWTPSPYSATATLMFKVCFLREAAEWSAFCFCHHGFPAFFTMSDCVPFEL